MANSTIELWSNDWMRGVRDDVPISELSIPGTHDSGARMGDRFTKCQWRSIINQLKRGIRFLDIRCVYQLEDVSSGEYDVFFPVYHASTYQNITFEEVQAQCVAFLDDNPDEFILMNIQMEATQKGSTPADFRDKFWQLIAPYREKYWKLDDPAAAQAQCIKNGGKPEDCRRSSVFTVEECRGRIVLIRSYDAAKNVGWPGFPAGDPRGPLGMVWNGFNIDNVSDNDVFWTQNMWKPKNGTDKGKLVDTYIDEAAKYAGQGYLVLNFSSYSGVGGPVPGGNAHDMNRRIRDFLLPGGAGQYLKKIGIVVLDFMSNTGTNGDACENVIITRGPYKQGYTFMGTDRGVL
jgi:1-phosphatidylinositol phosphodiesterase